MDQGHFRRTARTNNRVAKHREEVINVYVGMALHKRGIAAESEDISMAAGARHLVDVLITMRGLRVAIEGKYEDVQDARGVVLQDAKKRVDAGIAQMAVGVVYPKHLRTTNMTDLGNAIEASTIDFIVHSEAGTGEWRQADFAALTDELLRAYDVLVKDDVVTRSLERLQNGMKGLTTAFALHEAVADRLADLLRVYEPEAKEDPSA